MSFRSRLRRSVVVSISSSQRGFMPSAVVPAIRAKYKLRYRTSKGKLRKTPRVAFNFPDLYRLRLDFQSLDVIITLILLVSTCVEAVRFEVVLVEAFFTGVVL